MKKLFKRILHWWGNIRYALSYSLKSVERSIDLDKRSLNIAMRHPMSPEDVKGLLSTAEALGLSDELVEFCLSRSACFGYDGKDFTIEIMFTFRKELKRRGIEI